MGYRINLHTYRRGSLTAVWYRDEVIDPTTRFYTAAVGSLFVLVDNNERNKRAVLVEDYLESDGIARLEWLTYLIGRNPIENIWDALYTFFTPS